MPKPSELDLDILALDPRSSSTKISCFIEISKKEIANSYFFNLRPISKAEIGVLQHFRRAK